MKEKELRLALVCGGGISLAVYIHGVTKEIYKLARASKAFHAEPDHRKRADTSFADRDDGERPSDTENIYFDILRAFGPELDLRVVIDVVGGASAGGINGIFLARALAHDLPIDHLREVWLSAADVHRLHAAKGEPRFWYRWLVKPVLRLLPSGSLSGIGGNIKASSKISALLPLKGMRPPFDGERLLAVLYEALDSMGPIRTTEDSLLPDGHRLALFVTLTDFFGYTQHIRLDDPPSIEEREYRHSIKFDYLAQRGRGVATDFGDDQVPALAFAARATSSYPGAFPPAQVGEVDRLLARIGRPWSGRAEFIAKAFAPQIQAGLNPEHTSFMDGSVLNNKPFAETIDAMKGHPAFRQVDRRLIYIDPHPQPTPPPPSGRVPGFWLALKAALSDIPRNEPVHDDLAWIDGFNIRVRRARTIIDAARPDIEKLLEAVTHGRQFGHTVAVAKITRWRQQANERATDEVGFAYEGYVRLKLATVLDRLAAFINRICGHPPSSATAHWVEDILLSWAEIRDMRPSRSNKPLARFRREKGPAAWVVFLRSFDIDYRRRQIRFTIRGLNHLYEHLGEADYADISARQLDAMKADLYDLLATFPDLGDLSALDSDERQRICQLFSSIPAPTNSADNDKAAHDAATANSAAIDAIFTALGEKLGLPALSEKSDALFAAIGGDPAAAKIRGHLLTSYLGFAFWDIITFTMTSWRDVGEFDEIRVTRISPDDARAIRTGGAKAMLKGIALAHFGAFFSRSDRENDFLWGRLHGAERLIDLLASAARVEGAGQNIDIGALKKKAFHAILDAEQPHLGKCGAMIDRLRAEIDAGGAN